MDAGEEKLPWYRPYYSPSVYLIGVVVGLVSITAFFGALILAFYLAMQGHNRTVAIRIPWSMWLSTALILGSSVSIEAARRALRRGLRERYQKALVLTLLLGTGYILSQITAWLDLSAQGVYMQGSPRTAVFYAFTGFHALHVFGGMVALTAVYRRSTARTTAEQDLRKQRRITSPVVIYWHFMGALWAFLLALLLIWTA
jgi:cytochrome c oxidase subunit 3